MPTELETFIATFRQETEDLMSAHETRFYLNHGVPYTDEGTQYVEDGVPYLTTDEVLTIIPVSMRRDGMKVKVLNVDYWFIDGVLVPYIASMAIADNSVTLAKLINIATASFIGRKTAGAGSPEVLSVADVKALLGLTGVVFANFVTKVNGYSLIQDTKASLIHAAGSDDQDLTPILDAITDLQNALALITTDSVKNIFDIKLPNAASVAARCAGVIEIPNGWTVEAAPDNEFDLLVSHYLNRRFASATVTAVAGTTEQLLQNNGAYSGIIAPSKSVLRIQGLTAKTQPLVIHLFFS